MILILPINIAISYDNIIPLMEKDATTVCIMYSIMGLLAVFIHYLLAKSLKKHERLIVLYAALFTILGLILQLDYVNFLNLILC
jgi:positive regulator of sigma E activity